MSFQKIINEILPIEQIETISEKFSEYEISFTSSINESSLEKISDFVKSLNDKDIITLSIKIYETKTINNKSTNYSTFISELKEDLSTIEDEKINIKIEVSKFNEDGVINIYDYNLFQDFFKKRKTGEILNILSPILIKNKNLKFNVLYDEIEEFYSENILIVNDSTFPQPINKTEFDIDNIRINCHFENFTNYPFSAHYFYLKVRPKIENEISKKLDRLTFIFLIIGLYDITALKNETFYSKVNGYKSFKFEIIIDELDISSMSEYYKIYEWVYSEKSHVTDKIGLFRNIISIHLSSKNHNITENLYTSITSGYKSYLQNNINKYIEIRSKITEQVNLITQKSNELSSNYLSNYQKSNFAFISFFISVFLIRVLNSNSLNYSNGIFNKDVTIIFFALIGISLIYFIFSLIIFNSDIKRIIKTYHLLKIRNEDLLDKKDIQKILNDDAEFNSDLKYLKAKRCIYTILWIITLLIFISSVLFLSDYYNWDSIIKLFSPACEKLQPS